MATPNDSGPVKKPTPSVPPAKAPVPKPAAPGAKPTAGSTPPAKPPAPQPGAKPAAKPTNVRPGAAPVKPTNGAPAAKPKPAAGGPPAKKPVAQKERTDGSTRGGKRKLGQVLIDLGFIDEDQLWDVLEEAKSTGVPTGPGRRGPGLINEEQLLQALAEQHGLKVANLAGGQAAAGGAGSWCPRRWPTSTRSCRCRCKDKVLTIVIGDPANLSAVDDLRNLLEPQRGDRAAGHAGGHRRGQGQVLRRQGREHHGRDPGAGGQPRAGRPTEGDQHRPGQPGRDRRRRPRPQAHQHGLPAGHQGQGQRHPFRAVRGRIQDALPLRRHALRDGAAAAPPGHGHLQPHQGHVQSRHRRAPPAAGRPHRAERRRQPGGHARQHPADACSARASSSACSTAPSSRST